MEAENTNELQQKKFAEELAGMLEEALEEAYGLAVNAVQREVQKNNGQERIGITVNFDGSNISPTIYTEEAYREYQNGADIAGIAGKMAESVYQAYEQMPEMPELTPEAARRSISLTLVNAEQNAERLKNIPHFAVADGELAAIPRYYINQETSFIVTNESCGIMQLTPDEILKIGQENINKQQFEAKTLRQVMIDMMGPEMAEMMGMADEPDGLPEVYVLSSADKIQGAKALLSEEALNMVHEKIGDYAVLPSSIHEVLCMPISDGISPDELRNMVREVNGSQVAPEERLSDNIMKYDGHKLSLVGESFSVETPKIKEPKVERIRMAM